MKACWNLLGCSFSVVLVASLAVGCGGNAPTASISANDPSSEGGDAGLSSGGAATLTTEAANSVSPAPVAPQKPLPTEVVIKTSAGDVRVRLNAELAPTTVGNFLDNYVDRGFYNNTIFHHVDPGYILAGGYTAELTAKDVRAPIRNEADNGLK
ncbi:MAG: peptidylprolyl isomerase, partial [Planctomycetota bacterium]